jgi:hypothetical protein
MVASPHQAKHNLASSLRKRWLEWSLSLVFLVIGSMMVNNLEELSSPMYNQLTRLFPPQVWAYSTFATGAIRMAILYYNGRWPGSYMARVVISIASLGLWYNFLLLAMSNKEILITSLGLAVLPLLLEGLGIVFALQERASAKEAASNWFLHH